MPRKRRDTRRGSDKWRHGAKLTRKAPSPPWRPCTLAMSRRKARTPDGQRVNGATLKQAMQLARHSDPKLTMRRYGRAQLQDLAEAVERMPALTLQSAPEAARATGTENIRSTGLGSMTRSSRLARSLPGDAKTSNSMKAPTSMVTRACHRQLDAENTGFEAPCVEMGTHAKQLPPAGFEPATLGLGNRCSIH